MLWLFSNAGAVILEVAYGWHVVSNEDYFVNLIEEAFGLQGEIARPGRWLVDVFPIRMLFTSYYRH